MRGTRRTSSVPDGTRTTRSSTPRAGPERQGLSITLRPRPPCQAWLRNGLVRQRKPLINPFFSDRYRNFVASTQPQLGAPDDLVGEEGEAVTDGLSVDEARRFLVAGLAEEALAGSEHDREDEQPQLVDQVVLHQREPELIAGVDEDFPVQLLLELRDLVLYVAPEDR